MGLVSPFWLSPLLLLKLVGTCAVWKGQWHGSRPPLTKEAKWLESGKGSLSDVSGGEEPLQGGRVLGEEIPPPRWEEATPSAGTQLSGEPGEEQAPERRLHMGPSPPWLQGLCLSRGGQPPEQCGIWMVKTGLVCALGVLVVVGNGVVIAVVASSVSGWSQSSRRVLLSLAAADAALALLVVPLNLYRSLALGPVVEERAGGGEASYCRAVAFVNSCLFGASLYSLAGVSLERYIAIFFPLRHGHLLSRRRVALLIAAAWLLPALLLAPLAVPGPAAVLQVRFSTAALLCEPDYGSNPTYSLVIAGTIFCPAAGTVTFANVRLWLAARSQCQRGKGSVVALGKEAGPKKPCPLHLGAASRILMPVVVAFYICWAPCMATILYNAITRERVPEWAEFVALWLPTSSGFLNCFVYFWINRSFRHKFQNIGQKLCQLCRWTRQEQHHLPTVSAAGKEEGGLPQHSFSCSDSLVLFPKAQTTL